MNKVIQSSDIITEDELKILKKWLEDDDKEHNVHFEEDAYCKENSYGSREIVAEVATRFDKCPDESEDLLFSKIKMIYHWMTHA